MLNVGFSELVIICIVLIIAVGPERLPSMMKTLGKTMRTLRQASRDIRASTGIDELLREDFDLEAPLRRPMAPPAPPLGPALVSSDEPVPELQPGATLSGDAPPAPDGSASANAILATEAATHGAPAAPQPDSSAPAANGGTPAADSGKSVPERSAAQHELPGSSASAAPPAEPNPREG